MGSLEDHYLNIENKNKLAKLAPLIKEYNESIDTIKALTPKILESIIANPPGRYDWIMIDGKKCLSWRMFDNYDSGDGYGYCGHNADKSINLLQDGSLVNVREANVLRNIWESLGPTYLEHKDSVHISDTDAAHYMSSSNGWWGIVPAFPEGNGDRRDGFFDMRTIIHLSGAMVKKASDLGVEIQEPKTQKVQESKSRKSNAKQRKNLFSSFFK